MTGAAHLGAALLASLLLVDPARAGVCAWGVGVGGNVAPAGRGWDLSTPGPVATSASPTLSLTCESLAAIRPLASVDLLPVLRHSYRNQSRQPLLVLGYLGVRTQLVPERLWVGVHIATNGTAFGFGPNLAVALGIVRARSRPEIEVRGSIVTGANPDFLGTVALRVVEYPVGETEPAERSAVHLGVGPELGTVVGWRVEVGTRLGFEAGLRAGVLSSLTGRTKVQPLLLGYADIPVPPGWLQVELSLGQSWRQGSWRTTGGVALQVGNVANPFQLTAGVLIGGGEATWAAPDLSAAWVW